MMRVVLRSFGFGRLTFCLLTAFAFAGCAANRPPDVTAPRPVDNYPIVVGEDFARRQAAVAAWRNLFPNQSATNVPSPELRPVTATIQSLPELPAGGLALPPVGKTQSPSEEEIRESLRRFLATAGPLICEHRDQLTLVKRIDNADGSKTAAYEQRPFRYSLRGGFGRVRIDFTADRHIAQLSSSCLPDLDQTQRDIQNLRADPTITPDKIAALLKGRTFSPPGGSAATGSAIVSTPDDFTLGEPVILVRGTGSAPQALEFRLAWEVMLKAGFPVYVDAIDQTVLTLPAGGPALPDSNPTE